VKFKKKTQKLDNLFLIKPLQPPLPMINDNITSTPTTISNISIDITSLQEREQNVDFNETKIEEQNNTVSQVTNTKCTELFKDVVDNSCLNYISLDPYLWKLKINMN